MARYSFTSSTWSSFDTNRWYVLRYLQMAHLAGQCVIRLLRSAVKLGHADQTCYTSMHDVWEDTGKWELLLTDKNRNTSERVFNMIYEARTKFFAKIIFLSIQIE